MGRLRQPAWVLIVPAIKSPDQNESASSRGLRSGNMTAYPSCLTLRLLQAPLQCCAPHSTTQQWIGPNGCESRCASRWVSRQLAGSHRWSLAAPCGARPWPARSSCAACCRTFFPPAWPARSPRAAAVGTRSSARACTQPQAAAGTGSAGRRMQARADVLTDPTLVLQSVRTDLRGGRGCLLGRDHLQGHLELVKLLLLVLALDLAVVQVLL